MQNKFIAALCVLSTLVLGISGCARDLSSRVYTSDSTLSLTLQGKIVSVRPIQIKESDKLGNNTTGALAGGVVGGVAGSNVGGGGGQLLAAAGGAIVGGVIGALVESSLSTADGLEYIVKLDTSQLKSEYYEGSPAMRSAISSATTSGLITIVQSKDVILNAGQDVYVIFSPKRTRVIPA